MSDDGLATSGARASSGMILIPKWTICTGWPLGKSLWWWPLFAARMWRWPSVWSTCPVPPWVPRVQPAQERPHNRESFYMNWRKRWRYIDMFSRIILVCYVWTLTSISKYVRKMSWQPSHWNMLLMLGKLSAQAIFYWIWADILALIQIHVLSLTTVAPFTNMV